jgi:predicted ATP-grasp superfamily ATP-dependent carboligase
MKSRVVPSAARRALVLGAHRQSLTIVRSLRRAGFNVVLATGAAHARPIGLSRHVATCWPGIEFDEGAVRFGEALERLQDGPGGFRVIFPVGDSDVGYVATRSPRLPPDAILVMADRRNVLASLDKLELCGAARQIGLDVADFECVPTSEIAAAASRLGLPCVIKPRSSLEDRGHVKALILRSAADLARATQLPELRGGPAHVMIQRYIEGVRHNCHFVAHRGALLAYFEQRVLRTTRLDGCGNGVDGISVAPSLERRRACERLIETLGYSGPGCIQFLVGAVGGRSWFLELNPRLDATCAIAERSGYDLPRLALEEASHRAGRAAACPPALASPYRVGVRGVWTTGDLEGLYGAVAQGSLSLGQAVQWSGRMIAASLFATHHLTFRWSDPLPAAWAFARLSIRPVRRLLKGRA